MVPRNGSATIMILLLMVGMTIIAMTALKNTIAFYELALERMAHVRQEKALEALVLYGIAAIYGEKEEREEKIYTFTSWPPPNGLYQGIVTIMMQKNEGKVKAKLLEKDSVIGMTELLVANSCKK